MDKPLYIYNIYPRMSIGFINWEKGMYSAKSMGFNTIYLNSLLKVGSSGSIYSIADFFDFDTLSFQSTTKNEQITELVRFLKLCKSESIDILMDLVINHTAFENPLAKQHKNWYKTDESGNILCETTNTTSGVQYWYDCAKLNYNDKSSGLWKYMLDLCRHYLNIGFTGFRCDVAAHININFWKYLISNIRVDFPNAIFLAETLFCSTEEIIELAKAGFDYVYNSSRWWNFNDSWLLDQYSKISPYASSLSFPENHDTERLMSFVNGDIKLFIQRLWFTGLFSKGFMITLGCEFGYKNQINVVTTSQNDIEQTGLDFRPLISQILKVKSSCRSLSEESETIILFNCESFIIIKKHYCDDISLILINKTNLQIEINLHKYCTLSSKIITLLPFQVSVLREEEFQ